MSPEALKKFLIDQTNDQRESCDRFVRVAKAGAALTVLALIFTIAKIIFMPSEAQSSGIVGFLARGETVLGALTAFFGTVTTWPLWAVPERRAKIRAMSILEDELVRLTAAGRKTPPEQLDAVRSRVLALFDRTLALET